VSDENEREDEAKAGEAAGEKAAEDKPAEGEDAGAKAEAKPEAKAEAKSEAKSEAKEGETASPEAIARRVAALSEEDESDRIAREEERKLAERRATQKKGKKKSGLEAAASKKLAKIGTRAEPKRRVAVAADADPLIEKTAKLSDWAKKNQRVVQIVGALIAAALLGVAGFLYYDHKHEVDASVLLAKAVADESARIGEPPKEDEESDGLPVFKTYEARRDSALAKYREIEQKYPKTGAAILARLAEGSLLLDKHDPAGAIAAYTDVKSSALAAADQEVKGRAIEGLGFAYELQAAANPADEAKHLDEALKTYKELENTVDVRGFKELAMYHQARVLMEKGDKDKAKELLVAVRDRMDKPDESAMPGAPSGPSFPYLSELAVDRLRELDPNAAPKSAVQTAPGGNTQLTPAQLKKMMEELQKKSGGGGK
jgi:hypothetical protein